MAESVESRVLVLERDTARHEGDLKSLGSLVAGYAVLEEQLRRLRADVKSAHDGVRDLGKTLDDEREAREKREERERDREEQRAIEARRDKWARRIQTTALVLTFFGTLVAVIALVHPA